MATGDIAIYRDTTTTSITTTLTNYSWNTTVLEEGSYSLGSSTDITLPDAGHYLVIWNIAAEATSTNLRSVIVGNLELDGSDLAAGWGSTYIRNTSSSDFGILSGFAIIETTSTNEVLQLEFQRTDTNSATTIRDADQSGIQIIKLDDSWDYARISEAGGTQSVNTGDAGPGGTTWTDVTLDTNDESNANIVHSGDTSNITLTDAGHYLITYNVYFDTSAGTSNTRQAAETRLILDGTEINGTRGFAYLRGNANSDGCYDAVASWIGIIETSSASQVLEIQARKVGENTSAAAATIVANKTAITIAKLPDDADYIRLEKTSSANQDVDTDAFISWDSEIEEDSSSFSHDTVTNNSRIEIDAEGDYLFTYGAYGYYTVQTTGTRISSKWSWRLTGGSDITYGQNTAFIRGDNASAGVFTGGWSCGLIANGLSTSDYIELRNTNLNGASESDPEFTDPYNAVQGVSLTSLFAEEEEEEEDNAIFFAANF